MSDTNKIFYDSPTKIAFDLMEKISGWENPPESEKKTREYWLSLFHQCVLATQPHESLESILKRK